MKLGSATKKNWLPNPIFFLNDENEMIEDEDDVPVTGEDANTGHQISAAEHSDADEQSFFATAAVATAAEGRGMLGDRGHRRRDLLVPTVVAQGAESGHQEQQSRQQINHLRNDDEPQQVSRMLVPYVTHS